jgi:hypothetical protein
MQFVDRRGDQGALRVGVVEAEDGLAAPRQFVFELEERQRIEDELSVRPIAQIRGREDPGGNLVSLADEEPSGLKGPGDLRGLDQASGQRLPPCGFRGR